MQRYNGQLINQFPSSVFGNAAAGVSVTVKVKSTGVLATLYSDNSASSPTLANPLTTDSVGAYSFYAADDVYTLDFSYSGLPQQIVQLQDVAELQSRFDAAVLNAGYIPSGTFTAGATLTQSNQVLSDGSSYWRWDGSFPKVVSAASSPTPTGVGAWILISDGGLRGELAAANSTVLVGGVEAQRIAKGLQLISPKSWGILANGTDETAKWQSLITYCAANKFGIGSFTGSTLITSQLVFPSGFGGIIGDSQLSMVFVKGFNGDMFSLNSQGMVLQNFWIQGVGGTYTGGGVRVVSDNIIIEHMRITDTADSTIICNANAAKFLDVEDCHLYTIDSVNIPAIRGSGVDISTSPTVRKFDKISGSFYLLDSSGMNEYTVCNSLFSKLNFDANCSKGKFYGNRITAASNNITVLGDSNIFFGNIIAMGASNDLTIDGNNTYFDDSNVYVKGTNTKASPLINATYGGAVSHSVTTKLVDVSSSLVIKGTTTDWTRGNSTVTAYYRLADQLCYYTFTVIRGSTATNATGTWSVTLPFKALVGSQGSVLIKSSTGTYYAAILQVVGGGNSATLWIDTLTASMSDTSISFGTGGILQGTIQYLVASS